VRKSQAVHLEILGTTPEPVAMYAGLECGVIGSKHPGMQMIVRAAYRGSAYRINKYRRALP
jgi:di/tripeptidase